MSYLEWKMYKEAAEIWKELSLAQRRMLNDLKAENELLKSKLEEIGRERLSQQLAEIRDTRINEIKASNYQTNML